MHGCDGDAIVALAIAIARTEGFIPSAITLIVQPSDKNIEMRIIEPDISPWKSHTYLGQMLTREEVLASPLREVFFRIADKVVVGNPEVNGFLNR
jgi:hypothetical protein